MGEEDFYGDMLKEDIQSMTVSIEDDLLPFLTTEEVRKWIDKLVPVS